jgi:hypothetical protein
MACIIKTKNLFHSFAPFLISRVPPWVLQVRILLVHSIAQRGVFTKFAKLVKI